MTKDSTKVPFKQNICLYYAYDYKLYIYTVQNEDRQYSDTFWLWNALDDVHS